ncbi:MAG TPA: toprim domain-containing protein, partial [Candidatus Hydrogenedentes bacterium]|nr:toprim domain-containing protein [Candidatus Hydrogenedentota bacterium]
LYDFFRNRLIFPIKDIPGNTVAFGGRDLGDSPAKYINSPETAVYKKSRILYGLHEARDALRREPTVILVEGYFDLLRCFDAGIENVVATCGTALTSEQAALIRRYVPEVTIVYDGDPAGVRAALRGIGVLVGAGLTVRALALPDNQDPDDFIRAQGADAFRDLLRHAADFIAFYVRMSTERTKTIEGRTEVAQELFALLMDIQDEIRRPEYVKRIAHELGLTEWACERAFNDFCREARRPTPAPPPTSGGTAEVKPISMDDRVFIAALLNSQAMLERVREALADIALPPGPMAELVGVLLQSAGPGIIQALESDEARRIYAAAASDDAPPAETAQELVERRIVALKKESLKMQMKRIQQQIDELQRRRETDKAKDLNHEVFKIKKEIESLPVT